MKVRIGNDICLYVNLLGNKNFDAVNINSINAYLINTTKWQDLMDEQYREATLMQDEIDFRKDQIKYVSRFPMEPFISDFHPTPYDIRCAGRPCYHAHPMPCVPAYHGYGVYPHTFEHGCFGPRHWHNPGPRHWHNGWCEPHTWGHDDMGDIYMRAGYKHMDIQREYDRCRFLAPVEGTDSKNKVKVFFPANAQLYTGTYKLIIVAKIYEPGYKDNLRTITVDYENVFTLVNRSEEGCDGNVTIYVNSSKFYSGDLKSVSSDESYTICEGDELKLNQKDFTGKIYKLLMNLKDDRTIEFDPSEWEIGTITFKSSDTNIVTVNENYGNIIAMPGSKNKQAIIYVYNDTKTLLTSFTVNVIEEGRDYIVFINSNDPAKVSEFIHDTTSPLGARKYSMNTIYGTHFIANTSTENYLWIVSRTEISDSNSAIHNVKSSLFDVPLNGSIYNQDDHMYYYMCPNKLVGMSGTDGFDITVEPFSDGYWFRSDDRI